MKYPFLFIGGTLILSLTAQAGTTIDVYGKGGYDLANQILCPQQSLELCGTVTEDVVTDPPFPDFDDEIIIIVDGHVTYNGPGRYFGPAPQGVYVELP